MHIKKKSPKISKKSKIMKNTADLILKYCKHQDIQKQLNEQNDELKVYRICQLYKLLSIQFKFLKAFLKINKYSGSIYT